MGSAEINPKVPQAFGYTIQNDAELAKVITDPVALASARKEVEATGTYPTIYVLNHEARRAYAEYLGGRLPTQEEQAAFWDNLPGANVLEKATAASIPFTGYFNAEVRKFWCVGEYAYLVSSSPLEGWRKSLNLFRDDREAGEDWFNPEHGFGFLVVLG